MKHGRTQSSNAQAIVDEEAKFSSMQSIPHASTQLILLTWPMSNLRCFVPSPQAQSNSLLTKAQDGLVCDLGLERSLSPLVGLLRWAEGRWEYQNKESKG